MMWKGIRNLEQLYLSDNEITDIEPEAFKYLPNLQIVSTDCESNFESVSTKLIPF